MKQFYKFNTPHGEVVAEFVQKNRKYIQLRLSVDEFGSYLFCKLLQEVQEVKYE